MPVEDTIDDINNSLQKCYRSSHTGVVKICAGSGVEAKIGDVLYTITRLGITREIKADVDGMVRYANLSFNKKFVGYNTHILTLEHVLSQAEKQMLEEEKTYDVIKAEFDANYFLTPAPSEPPLVKEGDTVRHGQMIAAAMVMKKRRDIIYSGEYAQKVKKIYFANGEVKKAGDWLFALYHK